MQTSDTSLYTPTEAAVLTRLPLKAVNNAIDKKMVETVAGERAGRSTRLLDAQALVSLAVERRLAVGSRPNCAARCSGRWPRRRATLARFRAGCCASICASRRREQASSLRQVLQGAPPGCQRSRDHGRRSSVPRPPR